MKTCTKCKIKKELNKFNKCSKHLDGLAYKCKQCVSLTNKRRWETHKKHDVNKHKEYMAAHLWLSHYYEAKRRCTKKNRKDYPRYGGRGIKFLMTTNNFKELWFRDKAYLLRQPSIDRRNSKKNYELSNCRFIEMRENTALSKRKKILQKTIFNENVRVWDSIKDISDETSCDYSHICEAIKNKREAYGFKWEVIND